MSEQSVLTNLHKLLATSVVEPHGVVHGTSGGGYSSMYACQLLPCPIKCAPACTSGVLYTFLYRLLLHCRCAYLLSASILGVTEGETAYDQKCTWCGCEFTARLRKSGNFLAYVNRLYSCGDSVVKVSHVVWYNGCNAVGTHFMAVIGWCGCSYVYVCCFTKPVLKLHVMTCNMRMYA